MPTARNCDVKSVNVHVVETKNMGFLVKIMESVINNS